MQAPEFTESELEELAEFVCGRVAAMNDMLVNGVNMPKSSIEGCRKAISQLATLNIKLKPYYKART